MYINYVKDRLDLGFMCLKDLEDQNRITLILKTEIIYISFTILINSNLFMSDQALSNQSYSGKPSRERIVSNISNEKLNTLKNYPNRGLNVETKNSRHDINSLHLITNLRCGNDNLSENPDQSLEKVNKTLKESFRLDKLEKNLASKSTEDSKSFPDSSLNKIVMGIFDKVEPIIGDSRFWRILTEVEKPLKVELSTSVKSSSSKDILNSKPQKIFAKTTSSIFAEALVPINPCRWPTFGAGSAMASDMPDLTDKLKTPFENLRVAKEYLELAHSDVQWRDRLWQLAQDTMVINIASEQADVVGSFIAGAYSNKIADGYMNEIVETEITKNPQEKLNLEMFKQTAREQGKDVSKVRGTGVMREFIPDFMREDICKRPKRNARPTYGQEDTGYSYDDPSYFN